MTEPAIDALEERILADPDDAGAWEVYAARLRAQGDLRGELAELESVAETRAERAQLAAWTTEVQRRWSPAGLATSIWALSANRFYSPVIRIQRDRGHELVTGGPYGYLRHPGYAGVIVASTCGGIALGSWWCLAPLVPFVMMFVRRTRLEDGVLRAELEGYAAYARAVRYRLVPGVW